MSDLSFRRVARTGLAPLLEDVPEGPAWTDLTPETTLAPSRSARFGWLAGVGAAVAVLVVVGATAFLTGEDPLPPPATGTTEPGLEVFRPPTRTIDGETFLDLTLLDGSQITLAFPADLDLTSKGVEAEAAGGVGTMNRSVITRYGPPKDFIAENEANQGSGELTNTYTGPAGGRVERWDFPDIPYLVFDFSPWTVYVWDTKVEIGQIAEDWANSLHGTTDANGFLVLTADPPLELVDAADDPGPDGPDIRVDGSSGSLLVFINDCDRITRLDEEAYGNEVFAFCDEPTNTLFFVAGDAEVQERIHRSLRVNPEADVTTTTAPETTTTVNETEAQGQWIRVVDSTAALGGAGDQVVSGLAAGENEFVAVGEDEGSFGSSSEDDQAAVWRSESGVEWSRVDADPSFFDAAMTDVVWFPDSAMYVSVGHYISEGAVWISEDGLSWDRVALFGFGGPGGGIEVDAIKVGGPGVVAVGREWLSEGLSIPAVWMSTNGTAWDRVGELTQFSDNAAMVDIVQHGDTLFAAGFVEQDLPAVWAFVDNSFWELIAVGPQIARDAYLTSIASDGERLVVAGGSNAEDVDARVWTSSDDAQTWVGRRQLPSAGGTPNLSDVDVSSSGWFAVGGDGATYTPYVGAAVWTSTDGIDWNRYSPDSSAFSPEEAGVVMTTTVVRGEVVIAGGFTGQNCAERYARCELDAAFWIWLP
jgi:hypothetical protein